MKYYIKTLTILVFFSLFSCSETEDSNRITLIQLEKVLTEADPVSLSDVSSQVKYIQLETSDSSLIPNGNRFYADEDFILAISSRKMLVFDRETGRFLNEISHFGKDPGSYRRAAGVLPFDEDSKTVYASAGQDKLEFALDGSLVSKSKTPPEIFVTARINDQKSIGHVLNYNGLAKDKLVVFNSEGEIEKRYPNYLSAPETKVIYIFNPNAWFYRHDEQLYFCEQFNDTLFHVSSEDVVPRFVLDRGRYSPPYEQQTVGINTEDFFMYKSIYESNRYLLYSFSFEEENYTAVYDKEIRELMLGGYVGSDGSGFLDNVHNLFPINVSSVNASGELVGFSQAFEIAAWIDEHPELASGLPEEHQKYRSIKDSDNPVVVIVKLKE